MIIKVIGVDPGNLKSAYVILEKKERKEWTILEKGVIPNGALKMLIANKLLVSPDRAIYIAIEKMINYNQKVGASTFDTIEYIGRFKECWEARAYWLQIESMPRRAAVAHLCDSKRVFPTMTPY